MHRAGRSNTFGRDEHSEAWLTSACWEATPSPYSRDVSRFRIDRQLMSVATLPIPAPWTTSCRYQILQLALACAPRVALFLPRNTPLEHLKHLWISVAPQLPCEVRPHLPCEGGPHLPCEGEPLLNALARPPRPHAATQPLSTGCARRHTASSADSVCLGVFVLCALFTGGDCILEWASEGNYNVHWPL